MLFDPLEHSEIWQRKWVLRRLACSVLLQQTRRPKKSVRIKPSEFIYLYIEKDKFTEK